MSADGSREFAADGYDGGIYISYSAPSTRLNVAIQNGGLLISWLVPGTNFVLQQDLALDGAGWFTLTNIPLLNFTNLQNQTLLTPNAGAAYFRLKTQ